LRAPMMPPRRSESAERKKAQAMSPTVFSNPAKRIT
jgi:hypothetical protein